MKIRIKNPIMGVPITFMDSFSPEQFEILSCHEPCIRVSVLEKIPGFKAYKSRQIMHDGILCQKTYHRLFIRRKSVFDMGQVD